MMIRSLSLAFAAAVLFVIAAAAPSASAQECTDPGTCYIGASCDTLCYACTTEHPEEGCTGWRASTCGNDSGQCGGCRTVSQYSTTTNSQKSPSFNQYGQYVYGCKNNTLYRQYNYTRTVKNYETQECDGVMITTLVSQTSTVRYCYMSLSSPCGTQGAIPMNSSDEICNNP